MSVVDGVCFFESVKITFRGNSYPRNDFFSPHLTIGLDKSGYLVNISLFLHENICCW